MESLTAHYRLLLGLDDAWKVSDVNLDLEAKRVSIELLFVGNGVSCPECGEACSLKDHAPQRTWRHLDTMQFETLLTARVPRSECAKCGVKTIKVPWADKHSRFTLLFEAFAIDVLQSSRSVSSGAALLGLGWDAVHGIMKRAVVRGLSTRELDDLKTLGIDEKSFRRGQDYVSVMTDPKQSRVLEVVPGRTEEAANELWNCLSDAQKQQIKAVSIDMWQAFENSVKSNAPQAEVVYDKFHIAKYLNEAVDKVRRAENKELKQEGDERLMRSKYLWLTTPANLEGARAERFATLQKQQLKTTRAWGIKDYFQWFWLEEDKESGKAFFDHWYSGAIRSRLEPIKKVAKMLKGRINNILTWFKHRITNATSEGFNSRIQNIKSNARGFRNFDNYRTRILFFCGKLNLKPPTPTH